MLASNKWRDELVCGLRLQWHLEDCPACRCAGWPGCTGKACGAPATGVQASYSQGALDAIYTLPASSTPIQKQVLSLYRAALRVAAQKPPGQRNDLAAHARASIERCVMVAGDRVYVL